MSIGLPNFENENPVKAVRGFSVPMPEGLSKEELSLRVNGLLAFYKQAGLEVTHQKGVFVLPAGMTAAHALGVISASYINSAATVREADQIMQS